ncbi:DUF732 domain-containing protein [Mycobacterium sp. MMS18-G62]
MPQLLLYGPWAMVTGLTALLALAPPAAADQDAYLQTLRGKWPSLSEQQLLAEGRKVCNATHSGMTSADATIMVQKDLQMGVPEALDVVSAAVVHLGC